MNDSKTMARKMLKSAFRLFGTDDSHLSDDAVTKRSCPKCRAVAEIVHEVYIVNDNCGLAFSRDDLFQAPDGWITAPCDIRNTVLDTIEGWLEEEMSALVTSYSDTQNNQFERTGEHTGIDQTVKLVLTATTTTRTMAPKVNRAIVRRVKNTWYDVGTIVVGLACALYAISALLTMGRM